jgi:hypothetical protein
LKTGEDADFLIAFQRALIPDLVGLCVWMTIWMWQKW